VAAFRATLEEVVSADLVLHVRDISHGETHEQSVDVANVLQQLGIAADDHLLEVWNKIDRLDADARQQTANLVTRSPDHSAVLVSATTGEGIPQLLALIEQRLARTRITLDLVLDAGDGAGISWLYRNAEVLAREPSDDGHVALTVRTDPAKAGILRAKFSSAVPR
jgi:GTP-binding protein HflX